MKILKRRTENRNQLEDSLRGCFSGFGIVGDILRGWIVPVGGSTPDRLKGDRLKGDRLKGDRLKGDRLKGDRLKGDRLKGDRLKDDRHFTFHFRPKTPN